MKDENLQYFWGSRKNPSFRLRGWGVYEKLIYKGDYLTERDWTVCRFRGGLSKKEGLVFLVFLRRVGAGVDTPMHTMGNRSNLTELILIRKSAVCERNFLQILKKELEFPLGTFQHLDFHQQIKLLKLLKSTKIAGLIISKSTENN